MKIGTMIGHPARINGQQYFLTKVPGDRLPIFIPIPEGEPSLPIERNTSDRTSASVNPAIDV